MDVTELIRSVGYVGIFGIIFAESGLFFGFFLPGDSLLFTAGFLASQGVLSLPVLLIGCFIAAVTGDSVGYTFGRRVGAALFKREDLRFFKKKYLEEAQKFYDKYGNKTIVLARFVPIVRTFAPIVAGAAEMKYANFLTYNLIGGSLWAIGVTLAGYFLGGLIPGADKYILPLTIVIVFVSLLPAVWHVMRDPEMRAGIMSSVRKLLGRSSTPTA